MTDTKNRIKRVQITVERQNPSELELWLTVYPERVDSRTEIRGRFMGPRCRYTSTVEVAYPVCERSRRQDEEFGIAISLRLVIPDPAFWDPETPFLYDGPLELWQDGEQCDKHWVCRGFRALSLGSSGLHLNGRPIRLRGVQLSALSEAEALQLRGRGYNTLLIQADSLSPGLWESADKFGFLIFIRVANGVESYISQAMWGEHPSRLGWILSQNALERDPLRTKAELALISEPRGGLGGVKLYKEPSRPLPPGIRLIVCRESLIPALQKFNLPMLILRDDKSAKAEPKEAEECGANFVGWIDS